MAETLEIEPHTNGKAASDHRPWVNIIVAVPNEGMTVPPAYDNHMLLWKHLGALEEKSQRPGETGPKFRIGLFTAGRMLTHVAREAMAQEAINYRDPDGKGADYLLMYDDDMLFPMDLFERLYRHNVDVVAALAFTRNPPHLPVIYKCEKGYDHVARMDYSINHTARNYPKDSLVKCDAVGFGAVLIKMDVIRKMTKPWFMGTSGTGEDVLFCAPDGIVYGDFKDVSISQNEAISHTGRKEQIDQFHERDYDGELVCIKPRFTEPIRLTPNHPVLSGIIKKPGRRMEWIKAGDLTGSDVLFFPKPELNNYRHVIDLTAYAHGASINGNSIKFLRTHEASPKTRPFVRMNSELARMFGWYVAEGNASDNHVHFSLNAKNEERIARWIKRVFKREFGIVSSTIYVNNKTNSMRISFSSTLLARFFKETFGHRANNKRLPIWICDNMKFSGDVLRGLWEGDGMIKLQILTTTSRVLAHQVKNLLAANRIVSSIRIGQNEKRGFSRNFSVLVMRKDRKRFGDLIGVPLPKSKVNTCYTPFVKLNDVYGWRIPIEKIWREKYKGNVFNHGVRNNNSYVLGGVSVHNCYNAREQAGAKVYMDTSTKTVHLGSQVMIDEAYAERYWKDVEKRDVEKDFTKAGGIAV